jgi:hypothetical protein
VVVPVWGEGDRVTPDAESSEDVAKKDAGGVIALPAEGMVDALDDPDEAPLRSRREGLQSQFETTFVRRAPRLNVGDWSR